MRLRWLFKKTANQNIDGKETTKPFVGQVTERRLLNVTVLCVQTSQL